MDSQVGVATSLVDGGALDSSQSGSLGSGSVRAVGNAEIDDVSSADVVDETCWEERERKKATKHELILSRCGRSAQGRVKEECRLTVDVDWFEGCAIARSTTMGSTALRSLLGDVGGPMLFHHGAGGDVGYRVLHVLLDEGAESGVIVLGGFNGGVALVGFSGRGDLRAERDKHECTKKKKKTGPDIRKLEYKAAGKGAKKDWPPRKVTHRLEVE